jgi:hypothetical protein
VPDRNAGGRRRTVGSETPYYITHAKNAVIGDINDSEPLFFERPFAEFFEPVALCQLPAIEVLAEGVVSRAAVRPVVPKTGLAAVVDQQSNGLVAEPKLAAIA